MMVWKTWNVLKIINKDDDNISCVYVDIFFKEDIGIFAFKNRSFSINIHIYYVWIFGIYKISYKIK